jgi:hypothetical protein
MSLLGANNELYTLYFCCMFLCLSPQMRWLLLFPRRLKEMKRIGTGKIKEMLLSRLCAVYASQVKTREAQRLQKCFHVNFATKNTIKIV